MFWNMCFVFQICSKSYLEKQKSFTIERHGRAAVYQVYQTVRQNYGVALYVSSDVRQQPNYIPNTNEMISS